MADVLLARTDGIEGFQRHVVIKRIHAELLEEPRYVKMFLDEARLAASLHHHNIVQVNDIGEEAGEYFFAMEYVHGEDVRTLLVDASQRGELIPLEHAVTIITAAAAGLHHAHEQRGMDGTPLDIVHRDVSPANILVGYDGAVKVADFGIALASHRAEQTQSGVLKGKVAYMSPEQCNCELVDRRSDVFSLGIVLYELVTVRPCFAGDNDFLTMSAIVGGKLERPSLYRKDLPPALEEIILKALARNADDRYQTAEELRIALEEFAAAAGQRSSTTALADFMKAKFGTKALPWQEDDGDPEIEVRPDTGEEPARSITAARVSAPGRVLTPAPGGVLVATPRQRTPAPTVPLRRTSDDLSLPVEDDLAIPVDNTPVPAVQRKATLPMASLSTRAPGNVVVVDTPAPVNDEVSAPTRVASLRAASNAEARASSQAEPAAVWGEPRGEVQTVIAQLHRSRRLWLAGSIAALAIAAISLIVVRTGNGKPSPRASAAPGESRPKLVAPEPLDPPALVRPTAASAAAGSETAPAVADDAVDGDADHDEADRESGREAAPAPAKKARKPGVRKEPRSPTRKWDPDALFPQ